MSLRFPLLLPLALALVACSDGGTHGSAIPSHHVEQAVQQLDQIVADTITRTGVPGIAVAVVHNNTVVYSKGFGVRRLGDSTSVDPHTVFQLASLSKSVGATVVATQVGEGVISWDTPVVEHLPWFTMHDEATTAAVTIGDLYSHRSGLPDHAGDDLEALGHDRREVLERLHLLPAAPLRSRYEYTNFGLTAAAEAVAQASGSAWEDLSEQALYRPLRMSATSSRFSDFMAHENRASPHVLRNDEFVLGVAQRQPDPQSPAGGVSSNVVDMAEWMKLILNEGRHNGEELIPRAALMPALTPQAESSPASGERPAGHYGYGFNISTSDTGEVRYGHSGAFILGSGTSFSILPGANTGIIALSNGQPVGAVEAITAAYTDIVEHGRITRDWLELFTPTFDEMNAPEGQFVGQPFPENPTPPLPPHAYVGTYANDYFGEASVVPHEAGLALIMGPSRQTFVLRHWSGNVFVFELAGELAAEGSRSAATFTPGPSGIAQTLTLELFDKNHVGTLTRR